MLRPETFGMTLVCEITAVYSSLQSTGNMHISDISVVLVQNVNPILIN